MTSHCCRSDSRNSPNSGTSLRMGLSCPGEITRQTPGCAIPVASHWGRAVPCSFKAESPTHYHNNCRKRPLDLVSAFQTIDPLLSSYDGRIVPSSTHAVWEVIGRAV